MYPNIIKIEINYNGNNIYTNRINIGRPNRRSRKINNKKLKDKIHTITKEQSELKVKKEGLENESRIKRRENSQNYSAFG